MIRTLPILLAFLCSAPASAQWSIREMVDDMLPVVIDAAADDFASLRGDLVASNGEDSLWVASYGPAGPSGPMYAQTDHRVSRGVSSYWFTIPAADAEGLMRLYDIAVGSADTFLGPYEDALGWRPLSRSLEGGRSVAQWLECGEDGRVVELIYTPTPEGAEVMFVTANNSGGCPESP